MTDQAIFVPDIEVQVLGAILNGGSLPGVFAVLDDRHFVEPVNREIFRAARHAREKFSSTRAPVVAQLIDPEAAKQFKIATGIELGQYLAQCCTSTIYSAATAGQAARNVIAQSARLQLASELSSFQAAAYAPDADVLGIVRGLGELLDEVSSDLRRGGKGKTRISAGEAAAGMIAAAREAKARQGLTGITTGLVDLDRATGGLQRRDLILLGARPSMGKTTLGTGIAASAAAAGHGVGFLSLEMDTPKLMARVCSDLMHRAGIHVAYEALINGTASEDEIAMAEGVMAKQRLPLWIDDQTGVSIADLRIKIEAMVTTTAEAGFTLDLVVVDHLLKVRPTARYAGNRVHEIAEITEGLKELAREYDLAVLLLTQLNRAVEQRDDKRPTLADLRDSGAIEQDADVVMFLYREAYYVQREKPATAQAMIDRDDKLRQCLHRAELEIAKQRNGRVQTINLFADMSFSAFRNAARYGELSSDGS